MQLDVGTAPRTISATNAALPFTFTGLVTSAAGLITASDRPKQNRSRQPDIHQPHRAQQHRNRKSGHHDLERRQHSVTASSLTLNPGATLVLDNSTTNNANRISDTMPIIMSGGTIDFVGNNAAGAESTETVGTVTLNAGGNTIISASGTGARARRPRLTISNLNHASATTGLDLLSVLNLVSVGSNIGSTTNQIVVSGAITPLPESVTNGYILPYANITGTTPGSLDFASTVTPRHHHADQQWTV